MKIKVQCPCGSRFEFEAEPVNGQMPMALNCPTCGADATALANEVIRQQSAPAPAHAPIRVALSHAPAAPNPASLTPAPPAPAAARLRIKGHQAETKPAAPAAAPAPVAAAPAPAPTAAVEECPKHPGETPVETCRVCGKPICLKCMEQLGYVCSVYCRGQANQQKLKIPVYKNQQGVRRGAQDARLFSRVKGVGIAVAVCGLLLISAWGWYVWVGSQPKLVYTAKLANTEGGELPSPAYCNLIGPGELLSLNGNQLALFDVAHKKELWSVSVEAKAAPAPGGPDMSVSRYAERIAKSAARKTNSAAGTNTPAETQVNQLAALANAKGEAAAADDSRSVAALARSLFTQPALVTTTNDLWVLFPDHIAHVDRQTGARKEDVPIKGTVLSLTHDDQSALAVSQSDATHKALTQVTFLTGAVQTDEIDLAPKKAVVPVAARPGTPAAPPMTAGGRTRPSRNGPSTRPAPVAAVAPATPAAPVLNHAGAKFYSAGINVAEVILKLVEHKTQTTEAIKPKGKSILESGNLTAGQSMDATEELMNDMQRQNGAAKNIEDVSRYQITLHRWFAAGAEDWTGEVIGPPSFFSLKTVDVLAGSTGIRVFDKNNKLLWEAKLTYPISAHLDVEDGQPIAPCVESGTTLYFADKGMLTAFDLATGNARWRYPSVGISRIQLDDQGKLYLGSTTASPDSIQYTQQVDLKNRPQPVILKLDAETGSVLWKAEKVGENCVLSGKFLYGSRTSSSFAWLKLEEGPQTHYNIYRLNPATGAPLWNYYQSQHATKVAANGTWIMLQFADEVQVLKYLSL